MISTLVTRVSAAVLVVAGAVLLFASDIVLPRLIPDYPASATWLGQILGGAWLAVAALNWLNQGTLLGGIYGRPVVLPNLAVHFITAMVLLDASREASSRTTLLLIAAPAIVLAALYGWLMLRGPFAKDFAARGSSTSGRELREGIR